MLADTRDAAVAAAVLGAATLATIVGGLTRRAAVMIVGATALLVNGWIQYFVRLADLLPLSVRLVGFGVGLLLGGVTYEQSLRHRATALRTWE